MSTKELNELYNIQNTTKRITVDAIENIIYNPLKILDHGFIRVVDYMGDDSSIVQSARISYGRGTKTSLQDKGLINYLMRHRHTSPFEMCDIKFHVKMPIFVARQWLRHRTASVNEYSARYSVLTDDFYIPSKENLTPQSNTNNQGRSEQKLTDQEATRVLSLLEEDAKNSYDHYLEMMNQKPDGTIINEDNIGIARELARMNLPVNCYTELYWKVNLHNLLHFLALRSRPDAQYEIRVYALAMLDIVKAWVPSTYEAFENYILNGNHFSAAATDVMRRMLKGEKVDQTSSNMTTREWNEFISVLERS